jgi:hypothetical protein
VLRACSAEFECRSLVLRSLHSTSAEWAADFLGNESVGLEF